jgi:hypothetical protein
MKKLLISISILLCTVGFVACGNGGSEEGTLTVAPLSLSFDAAGDVETVTITGTGWTATSAEEWIGIVEIDGGISVTVGPTDEKREGKITVSNDADSKTVTVTQAGKGILTVAPLALSFEAAGGVETVNITGEGWTATSAEEWIGIVEIDGGISVTAGSTDKDRSGEITVANEADSKTVTVTQKAPAYINIDPESLSFMAGGGSRQITVDANTEWTPKTGDSWITASKVGETKLQVTVDATTEKRSGRVVIESELDDVVIEIGQSDIESIGIDAMVGTWHVTEKYFYLDYSRPQFRVNNHALVMTKESNTRLKIEGFAGYWAGPEEAGGVVVYAHYDSSSNTFTLLADNLSPSWTAFNTFMSGVREDGDYSLSKDINVSAVVDKSFSFMLYSMEGPSLEGNGGTDYIAYHISASLGNSYVELHQLTFNSVWKKSSDSTVFPPEWWWQD